MKRLVGMLLVLTQVLVGCSDSTASVGPGPSTIPESPQQVVGTGPVVESVPVAPDVGPADALTIKSMWGDPVINSFGMVFVPVSVGEFQRSSQLMKITKR